MRENTKQPPKLTDTMIGDALHYRTLLFNLTEPVIMSIDKYNEV